MDVNMGDIAVGSEGEEFGGLYPGLGMASSPLDLNSDEPHTFMFDGALIKIEPVEDTDTDETNFQPDDLLNKVIKVSCDNDEPDGMHMDVKTEPLEHCDVVTMVLDYEKRLSAELGFPGEQHVDYGDVARECDIPSLSFTEKSYQEKKQEKDYLSLGNGSATKDASRTVGVTESELTQVFSDTYPLGMPQADTSTGDETSHVVYAEAISEAYQAAIVQDSMAALLAENWQQSPSNHTRAADGMSTARLEKSRCAAKQRRDLESEELNNLSQLLPFPEDVVSKLDKGAVLRLALCYLQMKQLTKEATDNLLEEIQNDLDRDVSQSPPDGVSVDESQLLLEAMEGILVFISKTGVVLYASDNVEKLTGIPQIEMIGQRALEFIHLEDQKDFVKQFCSRAPIHGQLALPASTSEPMDIGDADDGDFSKFVQEKSFSLRLKCNLQRPGVKGRQNGHLLTQWTGRLKLMKERPADGSCPVQGLVAFVRPLHHSPIVEIRLDGNMFMSRHDLDMRYTFCDPRVKNLIGYEPSEMVGESFYQFNFPLDASKIQKCFSTLLAKGSAVSKHFRFLSKSGQWTWMKTRATVISDAEGKAEYIVCLNYVCSDEEGQQCMLLEEDGHVDCSVRGFTSFTSQLEDDQSHLLEKPRGSPSSSSSGYESGETAPSLDLLSPDSPPFSPLSVDVTSPGAGSMINTSPSTCSPCVTPLAKSSLDSDYPLNKCPIGFCSMVESIPTSGCCRSRTGGCMSQPDTGLLSLSQINTEPSSTCTSLSPPKISISLADHSYMASVTAASLSSDRQRTPPPSSAILGTQDFDSSGLSLSAGLDFDLLDEPGSLMSSQSSSSLFSSIGLDSSQDCLFSSSQDSLFSSHGSLSSSLSCNVGPFAPSNTYTPTISYACTRSVANDHDYSAKPKDDPRPRKKAASPPPVPPFMDNFSDAFFDAHGDSYSGSSHHEFSAPHPVSRPSKKRYRTSNSNTGPHSDSLLGALLGSNRMGKVAAEARQSMSNLSSRISQSSFSPPKVSTGLSIGGFATDILGSSDLLDVANLAASIPDKFSENLPEQRVRNQWLSYLAGESKTPPKRVPAPRSRAASTTSDTTSPPHSARTSGMQQRRNSTKSNPSNPTSHRNKSKAGSSTSSSSSGSHPSTSKASAGKASEGASLLEKFLLTEKPLNPMQGSDRVFPDERVTQSMSQLQLDTNEDSNLLKQLLTGQIDNDKVQQFEESVILDRKFSTDTDELDIAMDTDSLTQEAKDLGLDLFESDLPEDMDNLLGSFSPDLSMQSDIEAIVREELRHQQLWMKQYYTSQ